MQAKVPAPAGSGLEVVAQAVNGVPAAASRGMRAGERGGADGWALRETIRSKSCVIRYNR